MVGWRSRLMALWAGSTRRRILGAAQCQLTSSHHRLACTSLNMQFSVLYTVFLQCFSFRKCSLNQFCTITVLALCWVIPQKWNPDREGPVPSTAQPPPSPINKRNDGGKIGNNNGRKHFQLSSTQTCCCSFLCWCSAIPSAPFTPQSDTKGKLPAPSTLLCAAPAPPCAERSKILFWFWFSDVFLSTSVYKNARACVSLVHAVLQQFGPWKRAAESLGFGAHAAALLQVPA